MKKSSDELLEATIDAIVTIRLREAKVQINREIVEDLGVLEGVIMKKISAEIDRRIKVAIRDAVNDIEKEVVDNINQSIDKKINNQIVVANNNQLAIVKKNTKELVLAVGQQVQNTVYNRVLGEINEKIVPQVNNMVQWVNYNMQDGGEVIDSYRRAVEHQNRLDPTINLLTDGKDDKRVISPHVRTFFGEDD